MNEAGSSVRVPKGILKNSNRSSNAGGYDPPPQEPVGGSYNQTSYLNPQPGYAPTASMMVGQNLHGYPPAQAAYPAEFTAPVQPIRAPAQGIFPPAKAETSQWGMGYARPMPEQVLSEEARFRKKLDNFVNHKGNLVFRRLDVEEKPLLESRLEEQKSEGNFGISPSLDYYLPLETNERVKEFFRTAQVGDIVIGEIHSTTPSGLVFQLLCFDGGKRAYLEDLNIKGLCPHNQTVPLIDPTEPNRNYEEDDKARLEILEVSVDFDSKKLFLGMKGVNLSAEMRHSFPLGPLLKNEELPKQYLLTKAEAKSRRRRSFECLLESSNGFHNPNSIVCLGTSLGVLSNRNSLYYGLSGKFPQKDMANDLRAAQNSKWAQHNVAVGIRHFKQGNQVEAFQCLNKAIIIDPQNVEGLVARGALYANNGSFEKAIEDFEAALKTKPDHFNGRKYMAETLVVVAKSQLDANKMDDAVASLNKCLVTLPEHKESILTLMSIHEQIDKIDINRLAGSLASKMVDLKEKLRTQITQDIARKNLGKFDKSEQKPGGKLKDNHNRRDSSDSSSSSSSASDSDSYSSDDETRKEKSKKKKKHKKKSKKKKSNKSSKELSLSPFSKKLAGQDLTVANLAETGYADWGQQVGINQFAGSDADSQRASKKSKDSKKSKKKKEKHKRKKRGSSSDSDSYSRDRRKSKKESKVITDFGEIEEQLTAFFSKCEQGSTNLSTAAQTVKTAIDHAVEKKYRDSYRGDGSNRKTDRIGDDSHRSDSRRAADAGEAQTSEIPKRPEDHSNFLGTEKIVRTVQNDHAEATPKKFEMTFNVKAPAPPKISKPATEIVPSNTEVKSAGPVSKWRSIGAAPTDSPAPIESSVSGPTSNDKNVSQVAENMPGVSASRDGGAVTVKAITGDRGYRRRSSRSLSRSKSGSTSRSRSRSRSRSDQAVRKHNTPVSRRRSSSRSRRRYSRSRSRSRSRGRFRSHSRSRSRSRDRRFRRRSPGFDSRPPVRFFRGYHPAIRRGQGRFPVGYQTYSGGRGGGNVSKFRNRFSRSRSRSNPKSKSRSKSRSVSPRRKTAKETRSATKSSSPQTDADAGKKLSKSSGDGGNEVAAGEKSVKRNSESSSSRHDHSEIHVLGLTTQKVSDVEKLLDKHKAHKKEEIRESNPEFFRNP